MHLKLWLVGTLSVCMQDKEHHEARLKLTPQRRAAAGIEAAACERRTLPELVHTTGMVEVNGDRVAHLASRVTGAVLETSEKGHLGAIVEQGDALGVIHSLEFGKAQTDYRKFCAILELRQKTLAREKQLFDNKVSTGRELLEAESELAQAKIDLEAGRNQLEILGLTNEEIEALPATKTSLGCMSLRAPIRGTVIEKHLVKGEHVDTEHNLFTIADLDRLWVFADVYERDIVRISKGQSAEVRLAAYRGSSFAGRITHVAETMNVETRTLRVRIEVENKEGKLKPGMFAAVDIAVAQRADALAVPESAIQTQGRQTIVFVEEEPNVFERRMVRLGIRFGGFAQVLEGLNVGDKVATTGSFLLKCELEKESFEAGHHD